MCVVSSPIVRDCRRAASVSTHSLRCAERKASERKAEEDRRRQGRRGRSGATEKEKAASATTWCGKMSSPPSGDA